MLSSCAEVTKIRTVRALEDLVLDFETVRPDRVFAEKTEGDVTYRGVRILDESRLCSCQYDSLFES